LQKLQFFTKILQTLQKNTKISPKIQISLKNHQISHSFPKNDNFGIKINQISRPQKLPGNNNLNTTNGIYNHHAGMQIKSSGNQSAAVCRH
jgi:hypothetical protein